MAGAQSLTNKALAPPSAMQRPLISCGSTISSLAFALEAGRTLARSDRPQERSVECGHSKMAPAVQHVLAARIAATCRDRAMHDTERTERKNIASRCDGFADTG